MPWNQGQHSDADPMITSGAWRILRRQWKARGLPCARCGRPIDYAGGRFLASGKINRASFVLGHKVSRREARALGWSEWQINDSSNLQAEHLGCSNSSGAVLGRAIQGGPPTNGRDRRGPSFEPAALAKAHAENKARWEKWNQQLLATYGVAKKSPNRW
jgi:hypothetical protein